MRRTTPTMPQTGKFLSQLVLLSLLLATGLTVMSAYAASPVYTDSDPANNCAGNTPCFTTIQEAVNHATDPAGPAPAEVFVFPGLTGTYAESVDLSGMGSAVGGAPGDISLITVNFAGTPTRGTVTVSSPAGPAFFNSASPFPGNITLDGFNLTSPDDDGIDIEVDGNANIHSSSANGNGDEGFQIDATGNVVVTDSSANGNAGEGFLIDASGNVTISGSTANENTGKPTSDGFQVQASGNVAITDSTANGNAQDGFDPDANGTVEVTGSTANGNAGEGFNIDAGQSVTISDSTANDNTGAGSDGFQVETSADVTLTNSTANGNAQDGFDIVTGENLNIIRVTALSNGGRGLNVDAPPAGVVENVTIRGSHIQGNGANGSGGHGIDLDDLTVGGTYRANGNIICANTISGLRLTSDGGIQAEGNWWGDASGPIHPSNPDGTGDFVIDKDNGGAGTVDFVPWIDTISSGATVDPVAPGQQTVISFQFSDSATTAFLSQGPGDPNANPLFTLTTDNGTLTSSTGTGTPVTEFINNPNGILSVPLVPDTDGPALVTLTGPCGLAASITVQVSRAPTPPPTEIRPVGGYGEPLGKLELTIPWIILVIVEIVMAVAVVAGLRRRKA